MLLNAQPDIRVIGEATNGRQAVALARESCPDVAVLDISMPDLDGLQAAGLIHAECPRTQVLILTMHESDTYFFRAVEVGAAGYLLKKAASEDLIGAVRAVAQGEAFFYPSMARKLLEGYLKHDRSDPARRRIRLRRTLRPRTRGDVPAGARAEQPGDRRETRRQRQHRADPPRPHPP